MPAVRRVPCAGAAGLQEDRARAADGAGVPRGLRGDGLPGRVRVHVGAPRQDELQRGLVPPLRA